MAVTDANPPHDPAPPPPHLLHTAVACPSREQLADLLTGEPCGGAEADLGGHLETCAACQRVMERLTAIEPFAEGHDAAPRRPPIR